MERNEQKVLIDQTVAKLEHLDANEIQIRSRIIMIKVLTFPAIARGTLIHCSPPGLVGVDTRESIDQLLSLGKRVAIPFLTDNGALTHVAISKVEVLNGLDMTSPGLPVAPGSFGEPVDPAELDAVIAPGVVYGRDGSRLGREGDAYDRFLAAVTCPRIAPVFDLQLSSQLDWEEGMSKVDIIIGETTVYPPATDPAAGDPEP